MGGAASTTPAGGGARPPPRAGEIYAWIADQNRSAIRFYEHVGFADTGERAPITRVPGAMKSLFVWREHA